MKIDIEKSDIISKYLDNLTKVANGAFDDASKLIPIEDVTVFIRHEPKSVIPELGVGGYTPSSKEIYITVDAMNKDFTGFVIPNIYRTLLHEFHHNARWRGPGYGETLLEALVTEGLADCFELEVTGLKCQPWDEALSKKKTDLLLKESETEFDTKYSHQDWFYGSEKRNIPRWAGYSLGFKIVDKYLRENPDKKPSNLYSADAEIFRETAETLI